MMTEPASPTPRRHRITPLATALGSSLFALTVVSRPAASMAATSVDPSWIHFRSDPARRIFTTLPATRQPENSSSVAATRQVTTCEDEGSGSLRAVIADASDGEIIDLTSLTCGTITLRTGAIPIMVDSLTLDGPGRNALRIDGNGVDRVLIHPYGGALTLNALTIQHGHDRETGFHVAGGGCIASAGYVTLNDSTLRNCYAGGEGAYGGGLYAYSLVMLNSTLSGNVALGVHESVGTAAFGGAAFVYTFQLIDSTVSGNRADHVDNPPRSSYDIGGGLISVHGGSVLGSTIDSNYSQGRGGGIASFSSMSIANSTFSTNVAQTSSGGALFLRRPSTLYADNSTLSFNHAVAGAGVQLYADTAQLESSIVFGNVAADGHYADLEDPNGLIITGSNNLVGSAGPMISLPAGTLNANPLLGPLTANGGPTRTHALFPGSPAIDAGNNAANFSYDQRGSPYARIYGAAPDIGALEQQPSQEPVVSTPVPAVSTWMAGALATLLALAAARTRRHGPRKRGVMSRA